MENYIMAVILAMTTIGLSLLLVSKRRHCENVANLALYLMFFMCILSTGPVMQYSQGISIFCKIVMAGCLVGFLYAHFGAKKLYFIKDLDLSHPEHLEQIQVALRTYVRENLPLTARVNLDFRFLTLQGATEDQQKGCVMVINDYMNSHDCSSMKDWRWMIIVASSILMIAMVAQMIYYVLYGFS